MENYFNLLIITPEGIYDKEEVNSIKVLSDNGEVEILPNHVEYLGNVDISILEINKNNETKHYAVGGGCIHFVGETNTCRITLSSIFSVEQVDVLKLKKEQIELEKRLKQQLSNEEHKIAERNLRQAINALSLKQNYSK